MWYVDSSRAIYVSTPLLVEQADAHGLRPLAEQGHVGALAVPVGAEGKRAVQARGVRRSRRQPKGPACWREAAGAVGAAPALGRQQVSQRGADGKHDVLATLLAFQHGVNNESVAK